ncbi:hypothetical protein CU664_04095 [Pseudomonas syringae pv. actinidifoliorum]|uniref:DAPG hydrolase family protein n=1 Tax=Pseudomonas syringae TaxID=317 RepID=UPI0013732CDE|nr:hypothetical protein [Pseudomonas syringae]NAS95680.1 hypothetical protein [Pseudomonas syringae pv. actinidifoliorum]NAT62539.1 hypothetical protein [Pseudomonas syringae pv. actinidifoliorum]
MKYHVTHADRLPLPPRYITEPRYLGYKAADESQPYADFFQVHTQPIQAEAREALIVGPAASEYGPRLAELVDVMARPGYQPMESGYTLNADGHIVVSVLTQMPDVTGEMWDWWFGWHGTQTARYKLWHPEAHAFSAMAEDRSHDRTLTDRQRYIDNCSYVDEYLGESLTPLTVRFIDPEKVGFAPAKPGETTIVARGGFSRSPLSFAWLVHQVRATPDGCEMRSRFVVNDLAILPVPAASVPPGKAQLLTHPLVRCVANKILPHVAAKNWNILAPGCCTTARRK